jgi:ribonuclease HI
MLGNYAHYIMIQETHIGTKTEANELQLTWQRMWGLAETERQISFWSTEDTRKGGVAILLHPLRVKEKFVELTKHTSRNHITIESNTLRVTNIYAPKEGPQQTILYKSLLDIPPFHNQSICGGDFNALLMPSWDRCTAGKRSSGKKSRPLESLMEHWNLTDTLATLHIENIMNWEQYRGNFHTYGTSQHSSRLDRLYVSPELLPNIYLQRAIHPAVLSDHKGYALHWQPQTGKRARTKQYIGLDKQGETFRRIQVQLFHLIDEAEDQSFDMITRKMWSIVEHERRDERTRQKRSRRRRQRRTAKFEGVLPRVIKAREKYAKQRSHARREERIVRDSAHSSDFFARVAASRERGGITEITSSGGTPIPSSRKESVADCLATGWQHIMNPKSTPTDSNFDFPIPEGALISAQENAELMRPITREELQRSVDRSSRRKASGVDRINNDFLRDHDKCLEGWLLKHFNRFLTSKDLPPSFGTAKIITIHKSGNKADAMNYRPIALLHTFYKVFTRIVASRLARLLPSRIHESQHGFVPDRQLEDAIHTMQAVLTTKHCKPEVTEQDSPVVISLDFAKAYDTIRRDFLFETMAKWGFRDDFLDIIKALHSNTTAVFENNGDLSRLVPVTSGIRQGCPLAPLLFIIGIDPLARRIAHDPLLKGIELSDGTDKHEVRIIGYVDDTVLILKKAKMLIPASNILQQFGRVSGLQIQIRKCHGISLNTAHKDAPLHDFPRVPVSAAFRYLGVHLTAGDHMDDLNWKLREQAIRITLGIAGQKTNTAANRAVILNSSILPQILYTANFISLTAKRRREIEKLLHNFLWAGTVVPIHAPRARVHKAILALPRRAGGWGLQNLERAITIQAARKVARWAMLPPGIARAAGSTLLAAEKHARSSGYGVLSPDANSRATGLWNAGYATLERLLAAQANREQKDCSTVSTLIKDKAVNCQWSKPDTGLLSIVKHKELWATLLRARWSPSSPIARFYWNFRAAQNPWITDEDGAMLPRSKWSSIEMNRMIDIQQLSAHTYHIKWIGQTPTTHDQWRARDKWIKVVTINAHGWRPTESHPDITTLQLLKGPRRHWTRISSQWVVSENHLIRLGSKNESLPTRLVPGSRQLDYTQFQLHPWTSKIYGPEADSYPFDWRRLHHKRFQRLWRRWQSQLPLKSDGHTRLQRRASFWTRKDPQVGELLNSLRWADIWNETGVDASLRQENYYWRIGAFNVHAKEGIPHCHLCHQTEDLLHIMWGCIRARWVWAEVMALWGLHNDQEALEGCKTALLAAKAPLSSTPLHRRLLLGHDAAKVFQTTNKLWTLMCQEARRTLWRLRNRRVWQQEDIPPPRALHAFRLGVQEELEFHRDISSTSTARNIYSQVAESIYSHPQALLRPIKALIVHRLFFDGGLRANDKKASGGALLLRGQHQDWQLQWGSAFCLPYSTNNIAEYSAILTGLQQAIALGVRQLTIVGDSQLITRQLWGRYKVRSPRLQKLYQEVKRLMAALHAVECHHTKRSHNTAADTLANYAMDTDTTTKYDQDFTGTVKPPWLTAAFLEAIHHDASYQLSPG